MTLTKFKNEEDVTPEWLAYIENEVLSLSKQDDFEIDNYADREILNPDMQTFLEELPEDNDGAADGLETTALALSFKENRIMTASLFGGKLRKLKGKVRKFLCQVLADLAGDKELNWKDIIKAVLVLLIPALGAGGVWAVIVLPILISLIAKVVKRGFESVCPVAA